MPCQTHLAIFDIHLPNIMSPLPLGLYSAEQCREFDHLASSQFGIAGYSLMARAADALFVQLRQNWPDAKRITVFCGAGNNGGDGYLLAALAVQAGLTVTVLSVGDTQSLKGDAAQAYHAYLKAGGKVATFDASPTFAADVLVDALLGTGLARAVTDLFAQAIEAINQHPAPTLAVDVPSGLNANTGNVLGVAVKADVTVTFIALKQGLFTGQAADYCGDIVYADLEMPAAVFQTTQPTALRVIHQPLPRRARCSHKGNFGHVLVVGGNHGFSGASVLAGMAALRTGAGLVTLATQPAHAALLNLQQPELMCHGVDYATQLHALLDKASVVVIGPGLGQDAWAKELFAAVLTCNKPIIVDADALNLLAQQPHQNGHWLLTPHPGEAARLLACSTSDIQQDRFAAATMLQKQYQGVAVLKGSGSLIAASDGLAVCNTGNPGMASGGMGDTLCGILAGLLAQGLGLSEAARQGVYLHGKAADLAAQADGERGLLASDLLPFLRRLVN
ncbi:NAD(P)H-hydrate dehydratase [Methylosoma difficile]